MSDHTISNTTCHKCQHCGQITNYAGDAWHQKRIAELETALEDARLFANLVECWGRTDCEIYKHELKASADRALERIESVWPST